MNGDAEFLLYALADGVGEGHDFVRGSATTVDEDEGLAVVDAGTSEALSFPTALVDEPACGNLHAAGNDIMGHGGVFL